MKLYIADSLAGIFALDDKTGNILSFIDFENENQKIIQFYIDIDNGIIQSKYEEFLSELKNSGFDEFIFDNKKLQALTKQLGYNTLLEAGSPELKNFRLNLETQLKNIGIIKTKDEILTQYKEISEELTKKKVSQVSGHSDNVIIQIIGTLDVIKKSISLFSSQLREWYGLYFPELTDKIIEDNILMAKLISALGARERYTYKNLQENFDLKENRIMALQKFALDSMGANFDLGMVQGYAHQIISIDSYRQDLESYLAELMEGFAPNINAIIGSLIGAKLIAKAGSMKKLAYMPASRIQLLGAEKALYRFLKTGEKRPKHGLIFQWNHIRSAKAHLRGKIARVVSGKIGVAAKVDYFNGEFIGNSLAEIIELKIKEIKLKYPNPPTKAEPVKSKKRKSKKRR